MHKYSQSSKQQELILLIGLMIKQNSQELLSIKKEKFSSMYPRVNIYTLILKMIRWPFLGGKINNILLAN